MNVDVLLYDGFDELDAIGPYEVFDYALEYASAGSKPESGGSKPEAGSSETDAEGAGAVDEPDGARAGRIRYVTLEERETVTASHGTRIGIDATLPDPTVRDAADILVLPGGGWNTRDEDASAWAEAERGAIPDALAEYHAAGVRLASVCTGSMLLAEAGVTDGRRAVTHASAIEDLRRSGATVVDARVVDDGDLLTAGGVTSGLDLALYVVGREFGEEIADRVARVIEYDRRYTVADGESIE